MGLQTLTSNLIVHTALFPIYVPIIFQFMAKQISLAFLGEKGDKINPVIDDLKQHAASSQ